MLPVFKVVLLYSSIMIIPLRSSLQQNSVKIERWAEQLSFEVNNALEKNFGLAMFQSRIKQALYNTDSAHGSDFLKKISIAVDAKLQDVLRTLISNKLLVESESLQKDHAFKAVNCCGSSAKLKYHSRFRNDVDRNLSCVITTGVNSYLTASLEVNYKRNIVSSKAIKWQYFGSNQGSYHQYPTSKHRCFDGEIFDARLSSWYVNAAMSTRKRLVIIIDKSGSMRKENRMVLAKDAALTVLNTLTPDDYVTAIAFSSSTSFPPGCFGQKLAKATTSNIKVLREWIANLSFGGSTKYSPAFEAAFACFNSSSSTDKGENIILFLTDGEPFDKPKSKIYESTAKGQRQMNNTVSILAYGLGKGIIANENAKAVLANITTENRGHFSLIQDGSKEKLNSALGSYYQYFAATRGNVAAGKPAKQSSVMLDKVPDLAVNGYVDGKCSQTNYEDDPWWKVDLQDEYNIMAVVISNCCTDIIQNVEIRVGNNENRKSSKICGYLDHLKDNEDHITLCPSDISGRYVHLSIPERNKSLSVCEVRVFQVLAPSLTLSMPCTSENGTMFGVSAVDLSLSEVFSEILSFSYGQFSYAIVIDVKGRVWIHPRSPNPDESILGPSLLPLQIYESWASKEFMKIVLNQPSGQMKLNKTLLQFPHGYSSANDMKTMGVNATVHWKRLRNMFILIIVMVEDDFNIWLISRQDNKEHLHKESDKDIDKNLGVCQVNGTPFFTRLSTVKLALRSKQADVNSTMEQYFFVGEKPADEMLNKIQASHPGTVSDVIITGYVEKNWRKSDMEDDGSVMWRYVGTESGVYRRYPGFTLTENRIHKNSPWYHQAVMDPEKSILSHSFVDPDGRGRVISISKAVFKNRKRHHRTGISNWKTRIMAVAGIDMAFSSFIRMATNVMPGCLNEYDCYLMDRSGYLFVSLNEQATPVHVTEQFSWIGKQFVEAGQVLKPRWCNDFLDFKIHFSYEAIVTDTVISRSLDDCRQYILVPLLNISSSLLVVPSRRHRNCQDKLHNNHSEACHSSQRCKSCSSDVKECQTPCSCPMSFDRCSNSIINTFTRITCPVPTANSTLVNAGLSDRKTLNSTKVPECEKVCNVALNKDECSEISNCTWCERILSSCESFCPFNRSQRIGLKFTFDLSTLLPALTDNVKTEIEKNLQQTMYNVLGEKLENNIYDVKFKQKTITMTVKGSTISEIHNKMDTIKDAIASRKFSIDTPGHNGRVNECLHNVHDCHVNATCIDVEDFYTCSCKSGFTGDGRNCTDINECDNNPCHELCANFPGSFKCSCYDGYTGVGDFCLDINECDQSPCHNNATCTNQIGYFECFCLDGFSGNGSHCSDINECDQFPCHDHAICINKNGSFQCLCVKGFSGNGSQCEDVNECDTSPCHDNAQCVNQIGSFQCSCLEGFSGNGLHCQDVNECDQFPCHDNATCINEIGSFQCSCLEGFTGNGLHCQDQNECKIEPCHPNAVCKNTEGSYHCACVKGFSGNGTYCQDHNECEVKPCHANATCTNTEGSYQCICQEGFSGNGSFCLADVAKCRGVICHSNATCVQVEETLQCSCNTGFFGNGLSCTEAKMTDTTRTTPTVISSLEKSGDHHSTTTVIVLVITSFIVGISFGLCCIWFIFLRRSRNKNKVRPSTASEDGDEVFISGSVRHENAAVIIKNEPKKSRTKISKSKTMKPRKSFQVVSNVTFQMNEVEV